ncbi:glycoside hydrolase family 43 protein [Cellulomonas sp. KRMCY2]|uniref:glycoside hydrolase family 43 protein n=1 Tax=Cellulomonas sp. KRMCY2 TaxID=1304865 RepID=UPI00045EA9B8|nr:glycoside hydrolase family 43 protein [Cellulomonas sp. KRMCY2]
MRNSSRLRSTAVAAAVAVTVTFGSAASAGPGIDAGRNNGQGDDPYGGKSVVGETSPIHDPALVVEGDTWHVFSTGLVNRENGGTIQHWRSTDDGTTWEYVGTIWDQIPAWIDERLTGVDNLWAPEVYEHDGTYYLYYSASVFGQNTSITALATSPTLDPEDPDYAWTDQGEVVSSPVEGLPDGKTFNAIDAGIVEDRDGTPYMAIGSYWYGIWLVELEWPSGKPVANWRDTAVNIADRFIPGNPIEAPYVEEHDGWYYLFVSFDRCCAGADSTYKVAVGRSRDVTGPYLDQEGRDLFGGGGTVILAEHGAIVGPGGQSVDDGWLAFHYYDAANEEIPYFPTLGLQKLRWVDGWPVVDQTVALPEVTLQPHDTRASEHGVVRLTAAASGTPTPVAVWQRSDDGGRTWVDHATDVLDRRGRTTVTLRVDEGLDGSQWRAVFHNPHGTASTDPATVTVRGHRSGR